MANSARIVHAKTARATTGSDTLRVYGTDWNNDHVLTGLENVDNTSDDTKNAATATLTNKTIDTAGPNTIKINGNTLAATAGTATVTVPNSTDTLVGRATTDTLTNKTLTAPSITGATITTSTYNGNTWTAGTGTLTIAAGKTLTASNTATVSGTNTGDQTITLTGDVTGTGTGSFAATIGATKVTSAMLNADVFSTAHSWAGQQTFVAPILGTPASGTLTNATGLPVTTGISGLGTGVATFLATPSSANLRAALTDEVGTGAAYFVGGALGTPASGTATNLTGLPPSGLTTQGAYTLLGNSSGSSASPGAIDITALTSKASPVSGDIVLIQDSAASNAFKKTTVGALASAGSVASLNSQTGAIIHNVPRRVQGLTGSRNSGTATRLDLAADSVTFIDPTTNLAVVKYAVTSTACDIATAGSTAGGRDQAGAFSSGSTVHFYWIATATGATVSLVASLSAPATGPTLPSTYTMWAYATTMVMSGSNLILTTVRGSTVMYQTVQTLLSAGTATTETAVTTAVSTVVPANALTFQTLLYLDNSTAGTGTFSAKYRVITGVDQATVSLGVAVASGSAATSMTTVLPNVSQTLLYINSSALTRSSASIMGYTVPNGDS